MRRPAPLLVLLALVVLALPAAASAQISTRVMHGDDAGPGDYPWTVALVTPGVDPVFGQFCGGSLIDENVVLTAAHCVMGSDPDEVDVLAGEIDLRDADPAELYDVVSIHLPESAVVDPDDESAVPRRDMAVLRLEGPVTAAEPIAAVQPADAALWNDETDNLEVMGWGMWDQPSEFPDILQHATVQRSSDADCSTAYGADFQSSDMVCALGNTSPSGNGNVVDTCGGDSGGPLTTKGADPENPATGWKLVGTVSFGSESCAEPDAPGVYAKVDNPDLRSFVADFSDGPHVDDPPAQIRHTAGAPTITGTFEVGQTITCDDADTDWSADEPVSESARIRLYDDFFEEYLTVAVGSTYTLQEIDEGYRFLCEIHGEKDGIGGYGVARSTLSPVVTASDGGGSTPPPPPPATTTNTTIINVLPPPPDPQPFVPEPARDQGLPRTTRVRRRCSTLRRCTLTIATRDTTTAGAVAAGVLGVQVKLTSRTRCFKGGRRRTCVRRRTLTPKGTVVPGTFRVVTPRLGRGLHTVRIVAVDAVGNREPRPLTYSFRLR